MFRMLMVFFEILFQFLKIQNVSLPIILVRKLGISTEFSMFPDF
jgi:hypothetical protein